MVAFRTFRYFAICLALATFATPALAQGEYKSLPIDERARALRTIANRYVKSPTGDPADRQKLNDYVFKYHLPKMTQTDSASLGELGKMRFELMRNILRPAEPALATELTNNIFNGMKTIVPSGDYHRAVRYSALLLIGQLDARYAPDSGSAKPQPLPAATSFLCAVTKAGLAKSNVPAELIAGSLVGLERHARFAAGLPQAQQAELASTLLAVVNRDELPQDVGRDVEQWITWRAATALAGLNTLGPNNIVHEALMKRLADESADVDSRVRIAGLLGKLNYQGATLDDAKVTRSLLSLATAVGSSEAKFAEDFEQSQLTGFGGGNVFGVNEADLPSEYKRTRLLSRLIDLQAVIMAVDGGVKQPQAKAALKAALEAIVPVITEAGDKNKIDLDVAAAAQIMNDQLKTIANTLGVAPEEDAVEATDDEDIVESDTAPIADATENEVDAADAAAVEAAVEAAADAAAESGAEEAPAP